MILPEFRATGNGTHMRFMIVDDAETPLRFLKKFLAESGHQVVGVARNGKEAVEQFKELRPDIVVMDMIMPKLNGLEALKLIRREDPKAMVIMSCSLNSCDAALESEQLGASYCLSKPFDPILLTRAIDSIREAATTGRRKAGKTAKSQRRTSRSA